MPPLSVVLLRGSQVALLLGTALGALLLTGEPSLGGRLPSLRETHQTLLLFGWLLPFVLGTAYWMFPRHAAGASRGHPSLAHAGATTYWAGLLLRLAGAVVGMRGAVLSGTVGLLLGGAILVVQLWRRVRPFGVGRPGH